MKIVTIGVMAKRFAIVCWVLLMFSLLCALTSGCSSYREYLRKQYSTQSSNASTFEFPNLFDSFTEELKWQMRG